MVDWQDPEIQFFCAHVSLFVAVACLGCYVWEFLVSVPFDWELVTRQRTWRWTLIPYLVARYGALLSILIGARASNVLRPIAGCTALWKAIYACGNTAMACASLLLILRVVAISGNKLWVRLVLWGLWLADVGILLRKTILIRGVYAPGLLACGAVNSAEGRTDATYVSLPLYVCCLILVFVYLPTTGTNLVRLLISQGVVYFVAVLAAYVPALVLYALNLNEGMNEICQSVLLLVMVICATRMYRGLVQFDDRNTDSFAMASTNLAWRRSTRHTRSIVIPEGFTTSSAEESGETQHDSTRENKAKTATLTEDGHLNSV